MRTLSGLSAFAVMLSACLFVVLTASTQAVGNSPAWERLLEPSEPDTEAIARASAPPVEEEAAPEPVLTEQEKRAQAQRDAREVKAAQDTQRRAEREARAAERRQAREARAAKKRADREARTAQRTADRQAKEYAEAERSEAPAITDDAAATPEGEEQLPEGADYDMFADHAPLPAAAPAQEVAKPEPTKPEPPVPAEPPTPAEAPEPAAAPPTPEPPPVAEPQAAAAPEPAPSAETADPTPAPTPEPAAEIARSAEPPAPEPAPEDQPQEAPAESADEPDVTVADNDGETEEAEEPTPPDPATQTRSVQQRPIMERSKAPPRGERASAQRAPRAPKEPKTPMPGRFGLRVGLGVGGLSGHEDIKELTVKEDTVIKLGTSLSTSVGITYTKPINEYLSVSGDLQYSFYTAFGERENAPDSIGSRGGETIYSQFKPLNEANVELHSIELPVTLRLNLGEFAYMELGPQFGVNVYARLQVDSQAYTTNLQNFAFGPTFGAGVTVRCISMGLRAHVGLIEYAEDAGGKPWSLQFSLTSGF